jgi:hypothetical protein
MLFCPCGARKRRSSPAPMVWSRQINPRSNPSVRAESEGYQGRSPRLVSRQGLFCLPDLPETLRQAVRPSYRGSARYRPRRCRPSRPKRSRPSAPHWPAIRSSGSTVVVTHWPEIFSAKSPNAHCCNRLSSHIKQVAGVSIGGRRGRRVPRFGDLKATPRHVRHGPQEIPCADPALRGYYSGIIDAASLPRVMVTTTSSAHPTDRSLPASCLLQSRSSASARSLVIPKEGSAADRARSASDLSRWLPRGRE